ncbi:hypothetical protein SBRCBS47491_009657 [Sporothrix bragantina]|uniref:Uncharacterized protein n=1 Tax=Sporothrix bragantina TaxID=671064 RepID=A0ABP0D023_9PEZI
MTSFNNLRERAQADRDTTQTPPLPSPGLPHTNHSPSVTTSSAAGGTQRSKRSRGLLKVSSLLNLRGNSSSLAKKVPDEDFCSATPVPSSPRDISSALQWLDFGIGRRRNSRSSSRIGGHERDKDPASDLDPQQSLSSSQDMPSQQGYLNSSSSPIAEDHNTAARNSRRSARPHDWKQWDKEDDSGTYLPINEADFVWHRPTFKQVIESLQVAIVSGETVPTQANTSPPWANLPVSKPSSRLRSKRRPFIPALSKPSTIGPEYPIPGRYRSHIMRAIEGIHDIQEALDSSENRVAEIEEVLRQFSDLSKRWSAREQELADEYRRLREELQAMKNLSPE